MRTIPTDSSDARELRELEQAHAEAEHLARREHAERCRGGWLGLDSDERPIPCPECRPELVHVACRLCGAPWKSCNSLHAVRRGPCCDGCDHRPRPITERTSSDATTKQPTAPPDPSRAPAPAPDVRGHGARAGRARHPLPGDPRGRRTSAQDPSDGMTSVAAPSPIVAALPVRIPGERIRCDRSDRLLLVADPDTGTVPVRWKVTASADEWMWKCGECGTQPDAGCLHAWSAAIHLAESLLGLVARPEYVTHTTEGNNTP